MKFGGRTFQLALIGAISAALAFLISAPFTNTLAHPGMSPTDPAFNFTLGTKWGTVNHWASGALLCFGFAFVLAGGRKGFKYGLLSALFAAPLGGALGAFADSSSDRIGIALFPRFGEYPAPVIWSLLVPAAYAITIAICTGLTTERAKRAVYAIFSAWIISTITMFVVSIVMVALAQSGFLHLALSPSTEDGGLSAMKADIPIWEATAVAVGFVLGIVFGRAESMVRAGAVMLMLGRNEGKEWNLDYVENRIGSTEGVEIPIRGFAGVAPLHARIVRHRQGFLLEDLSGGALQLNGYPVQQAWLNTNDMIGIGQAMLIFSSRRNARVGGQPFPPMPQTVAAPVVGAAPRLVDAFGNIYPLQAGANGVGRDAGNVVSLHWDSSVSRRHAEIRLNGTGFEILDLGSSNGTRVNGQPIASPTSLRGGDAIQVGNVMLQYLA